jgi:FdrA protein
MDHVELRAGAYADSVTLLQVSRRVQDLPGVVAAQVAMATPLNLEVLERMGFDIPAEATVNHLVVAVRLGDSPGDRAGGALDGALDGTLDGAVDQVRAEVERALTERRTSTPDSGEAPPRTTGSALRREPGALVIVSVPGASAAVEAMDALEAGSDVMIFSDNVPVEQEVALKRYAAPRGLLVMGPDCGTAVVDGLGLGFANVVAPGPVGIVAASGTGCQHVMALLDHAGVGISTAYGVGGRDLSAEVGGLATQVALDRLQQDPATELVVLLGKSESLPRVAADAPWAADGLRTPVVTGLLGPGRPDLTSVTEEVLRRLGREVPGWPVAGSARAAAGGDTLHGLFVGGTLKNEAAAIVAGAGARAELVDFGDDAYTAGRAHPMIDPGLRLEHLGRVAADDRTGVIMLDVVLGHGAEPDPAATLAPALAGLRPPVVVTVVGTAHDPQGLGRQVDALVEAGAEVHLSNAGATRRALELLGAPR